MTHWTQQRWNSFRFAAHGLRTAWRTEVNLRIHVAVALATVALGVSFHLQAWEWMAVIGCIVLVLAAELFNTCLEKLIDHLHPTRHRNIRRIKDMAAAAVLLTALGAVAVGLLIFLPKIFSL